MKTIHNQLDAHTSPWTFSQRLQMIIWELSWWLFCSWTPKPANPWRILWLRIFGAKIFGRPFVHQRARIQIPWNITLHNRAAIGDRATLYSLGCIEVHAFAIIAQEAYICTGTHDFTSSSKNLITSPIIVGRHSFIGARAFILPGVTIGEFCIVGACSVVPKSIESNTIVAGNPAILLRRTQYQNT